MQRIIQQITQQFINRLPENEQYYRLDELRSWGFPSFIVKRIKIELERNLADSMIIPKSDWANTNSDAVLAAWQSFVDAIRAEARLPASYAKTVIETAVADVVEMLVQPRKNIPSVVFGTDDELAAGEVYDRLEAVVVYPHFAALISRYLQKKELEKLSKERCQKIVADADEKLTAGYSPLNWAQMLEPLFRLMDNTIDTSLLRLFFEDKNKPRVARKLDLMNDSLSRAQLIEVLSSPDLLDFDGYESEQSSLFDDQSVDSREQQKFEEPEPAEEPDQSADEPADLSDDPAAEAESEEATESDSTENPLKAAVPDKERISAILFPDEAKDGTGSDDINLTFSKPDSDGESHSLNTNFVNPNQEELQAENEDSLNSAFRANENSGSSDQKKEEKTAKEKQLAPKKENEKNNGQKSSSPKKEKTPIWMRYMSDEEIEEYEKEQQQEDGEEDDFIEEPIIDLTKEDASEAEIEELSKLLETDREVFVDEIFRGSERAFDEAIEDIAAYDSWRGVSEYIEKNVFKRNLVDMYSEAAVDFTDRLQTYFLKKQNQN